MLFEPLPRAILLDVGFTLTFCDGQQIAAFAARAGVTVEPAAIEGAEGALRAELRETVGVVNRTHDDGGKRYLAGVFRRTLVLAGYAGPALALENAVDIVLGEHLRRNVWCRVGDGVLSALGRLRAAGCRLAVVSNSEGTVEAMLESVGLRPLLDTVVDSAVVGLVKPDPRIFQLALGRLGIEPQHAVMVGDSPSADVAGARAVGARAALLDPFDLYPSADAPRFRDLAAFTDAVLRR